MKRVVLFAWIVSILSTNVCHAQTRTSVQEEGAATQTRSAELEPHENWAELNAEKAGLGKSPTKVMVLGKSEFPGYSNELVRVQWRENDPIDLYVLRPHGAVNPPVILYLYSFSSDTDHFTQKAWGEFVTKKGIAAVGFVSAVTGQRYHTRPMKEWFVSELQESLGASTHDVQMVLNYLATRGDLDTSRVGMLGEGSGAAIGILAAAADPRIEFVDAINPWGDWPDWLKESPIIPEGERARYLTPEFLARVSKLDPVTYLPQFAPGRIRIEQVLGDRFTPAPAQKQIASSAPASSLVQYPDMDAEIEAWTKHDWWLHEKLSPTTAPPIRAENDTH